jgi:hypothetical protein
MEELKYNFPKKILLSVTTHGILKSWKSKAFGRELDTFIIPDGIKLIKMNIATLGECNFMAPETVTEFTKLIKRYEPYIIKKGKEDRIIKQKLESISKLIKTKEEEEKLPSIEVQMLDIIKKKKEGKKLNEDEKEMMNEINRYLTAYNKSYNISIFNPGEITVNKTFKRSNIEANKSDWIIKIINMPNQPDLLPYMVRQTRKGESEIKLEEIVNFLKERGVEEIFLIDFSCALFEDIDEGSYVSSRESRRSRRSIKQRSIYGGRPRRRTINNNTKKNRKTNKNKTKSKTKRK